MENKQQLLSDLLVSVEPREVSGSVASNRFDFQISWAIDLILRLQLESENDYCVLFEFHDDIVVLDSSSKPTAASFFQVKTKDSGNWTVASLLARRKGKDGSDLPSHLGKLYGQFLEFGRFVAAMQFVSNAPLKVGRSRKSRIYKDSVKFSKLDSESVDSIQSKLKEECEVDVDPIALGRIGYQVTNLSVRGHQAHIEGIVSDFLCRLNLEWVPPRPFHRTLRSEFSRRSNREMRCSVFSELVDSKGISRSEIQAIIGRIEAQPAKEDVCMGIQSQLAVENIPFMRRGTIMRCVRQFLAESSDPSNLRMHEGIRCVDELIQRNLTAFLEAESPLTFGIRMINEDNPSELKIIADLYSVDFVHAMLAVRLHEQKPSTSGSQSKKETS